MDTFTVTSVALRILVRKWHEREEVRHESGVRGLPERGIPKNPQNPSYFFWDDSVAQKQGVGYEIALEP